MANLVPVRHLLSRMAILYHVIAQLQKAHSRRQDQEEAPLAAAMPGCCTFLMGKDRLTVREEQAGRLTSIEVGFP